MKLLIGTRNTHKLEEIKKLLQFDNIEIASAFDYPDIPDVIEDGATFEENAIKKAKTLSEDTGCWVLADDSGLEVDALEGRPGIYSARFAGQHGNTPANNKKLLDEMKEFSNRSARFICVMALYGPDGTCETVKGICEGRIAEQLDGGEGFGYDPLFIPNGYNSTFGMLGASVKDKISHRSLALQKAATVWRKYFIGE